MFKQGLRTHQIVQKLNGFGLDFRINLRFNQEIYLFVKTQIISEEVKVYLESIKDDFTTVEFLNEEDLSERFYKNLFDNSELIQGLQTSYSHKNIFDTYEPIKKNGLPPIISFYSYKGGVGRTTTLACFAAYLAMVKKKKVFMLDCDFEAPGFFNFFELNAETFGLDAQTGENIKNGLVEYLMDKQILEVDLDKYVINKKEYAGEGELYVMPAGNLSHASVSKGSRVGNNLDRHIDHYLHGLARLDLANPYEVERQFEALFQAIKEKYNPDVILIDSRTGFSEVFSNLVTRFSDLVLGFFGNNDQNQPGFEFFMQTFQKHKEKDYVLVNSLLFDNDFDKDFAVKVRDFINTLEDRDEAPIYPAVFEILNNNATLQKIGSNQEKYKSRFIRLIQEYYPQFPAHHADFDEIAEKHFFDFLHNRIFSKPVFTPETENGIVTNTENTPTETNLLEKKKAILSKLDQQYFDKYKPDELEYAENLQLNSEFLDKFFYFRTQMFDILNENKYIIRGYKGTGKTLFYNALTDTKFDPFRDTFLRKTKSHFHNFVFVDMVVLDKITNLKGVLPNLNNYKRFWTVYIWNVLMFKKQSQENNLHNIILFDSKLPCFELASSNENNWKLLGEYIKDEHFFTIEKELLQLDEALKKSKTKLLLLFDYLDKLILPNFWSEKNNPISPLIENWRFRPYSNIESKFFIRTDLYYRLQGINNFNALETKVINFDWKREELFVYFFQILLKVAKQDFYDYAQKVTDSNFKGNVKFYMPLNEIKQNITENEDQIKLTLRESNNILKTFVSIFFGEFTDLRSYAEKKQVSYNWFFNNLSNANGTFSLRVFIVLLRKALIKVINENYDSKNEFPIISGYYFTNSNIRKEAANTHLKDLISEENNLSYFKVFFDENQRNQEYKSKFFKTLLYQSEMKELLEIIIQENTLNISWRDFLKILDDNGIVRKTETTNPLAYSFAFLYKYALGLRSNWS